jgi:hypothetical protein
VFCGASIVDESVQPPPWRRRCDDTFAIIIAGYISLDNNDFGAFRPAQISSLFRLRLA